MGFDRNLLPDPPEYYESRGLVLTGPRNSPWKTTRCDFHGGSDSMRINTQTGGWICMSCYVHGGDVLSFEMQADGVDFVTAAKALGAWIEDGRAPVNQKPTPLNPKAAMGLVAQELMIGYVVACDVFKGIKPSEDDMERLGLVVYRLARIAEVYHG